MKRFSEFILEEDEGDDDNGKRALISVINSNFQRLINQPDAGDNRGLLILIAALGVLNSSDDPQSLATAKRLTTLALSKKAKKKEK